MLSKLICRGAMVLAIGATAWTAPVVAQARAGAAPTQVGPANGSLLIIGGALRSDEIYERFIELAGGPDAHIVMIPTAGGGEAYDDSFPGLQAFRDHGANNLTVLHTTDPAEANTDAFVEPLKTATAVYFFGGRQWHLVDAYGGTKTEVELRRVLERGGVIAGSSAGASIQGSYLIRGDTSGSEVMMGDHERGFAYLRNVGIDQHVLRRNRQFDMIAVIEAHPELLGIGLDEDTGIVVTGDTFEVIGSSRVLIFDNQTTTGENGKFYFLAPGDHYNLATRQGTTGAQGRPIQGITKKPWGN
ncbi:MAG: cyanophycinase [Gemmatimonadetes bacterium]|nr:cyanophycinase [Gemmatimonadota bacterium]